MTNCNCCCRSNCTGLSVFAAILVSIVTGILTFMGTIALTTPILYGFAGVAAAYLGIAFFVSLLTCRSGYNRCSVSFIPTFLTGVIGTLLTSAILLLFTLPATGIITAVITGLSFGFVTLILASVICLILCCAGCRGEE